LSFFYIILLKKHNKIFGHCEFIGGNRETKRIPTSKLNQRRERELMAEKPKKMVLGYWDIRGKG